jgi:hypothetical protein
MTRSEDSAVGMVSLGEGRELPPSGECDKSTDGLHHYQSVSCVQSVEHFSCRACGDSFYD